MPLKKIEPKRGSVEAFKASEERRQARIAKQRKGFNIFKTSGVEKRKKENEAFNKKVDKINKSRVNQESVKKFRASEDRRMMRLKKANPNNKVIQAKVQKRLDKKKNIVKKTANVEQDLPKSQLPIVAVKKAPLIVAKKVATKTPIDSPKAQAKGDVKGALTSFGQAFKAARAKGVGTKFAYNDKMYSAVTRDDISRSGKSNLKEFLNASQRKSTKIAKAPGQIVKKSEGGSIMARGCKMGRKKATKIY